MKACLKTMVFHRGGVVFTLALSTVFLVSCLKDEGYIEERERHAAPTEIVFDTFVGALPETKACAYSDTVPGLRPITAGGYGMLRPKKEGRHTANISMSRHYFEDLSDPLTKATATEVTSVSTFNLVCTTGSAGSESQTWALSGTGTSTGKYWPSSNPSYHFYASNAALTFNAAGCTVAATNTTDVVVCYKASPTYNTSNSLSFSHIFGRIGNVTVSAADGFASSDITNVNIKITPKTGGTYNLRTGAWSSVATGSATTITNTTPGTKNNGLYLVPGTYTVSGTWKAKGKDFDGSGSVTVTAGQQLNITFTLGGELYILPGKFSVASGKTVSFACGNVWAKTAGQSSFVYDSQTYYYFTASDWGFFDHQYNYAYKDGGQPQDNKMHYTAGSTVDLFAWVGASCPVNMYGLFVYYSGWYAIGSVTGESLKTDWGSIPTIVSKYDSGWFTMNTPQTNYLFNTRTSSVTGDSASTLHSVGSIVISEGDTRVGAIILPDNWVCPSNCSFSSSSTTNEYNMNASGSSNSWRDMEAAGAVFLPKAGTGEAGSYSNIDDTFQNISTYSGRYWVNEKPSDTNGKCFDFFNSTRISFSTSSYFNVAPNTRGSSVRLVRYN